ncbi:hypothetical protein Ancab_014213 [Ancistrocladus abbreviatus]
MGASRKLQGEINHVLKKVQEAINSIWNKLIKSDFPYQSRLSLAVSTKETERWWPGPRGYDAREEEDGASGGPPLDHKPLNINPQLTQPDAEVTSHFTR